MKNMLQVIEFPCRVRRKGEDRVSLPHKDAHREGKVALEHILAYEGIEL